MFYCAVLLKIGFKIKCFHLPLASKEYEHLSLPDLNVPNPTEFEKNNNIQICGLYVNINDVQKI